MREGGIYGFTHRLNQAVYHSGMTQAEIAERLGLSRQCVINYMTGKSVMNAAVLASIGTLLDVSTDWLLYGDSGRVPPWI